MGLITGKYINCKTCNKEFWLYKSRKTIYCSNKCYSETLIGKKLSPHAKKIALETLAKWSFKRKLNAPKGEENIKWKGDDVGYRALHYWIERKLGKAKECSICGKSEGRMHWANVDHKYNRDKKDFFSACPKCHKAYDKSLKG